MAITNVLAELAVADFDAALAWYGRFFGRPPDRRPMDGLAEWQPTESGAVQLFQDPTHAGHGLLTLAVDDLQRHLADLGGRGITAGEVARGDTSSFASVTDPEGNTITLAEAAGATG